MECFDREERHEAEAAERGAHLRPVRRQPRHPETRGDRGPLRVGKQVQGWPLKRSQLWNRLSVIRVKP